MQNRSGYIGLCHIRLNDRVDTMCAVGDWTLSPSLPDKKTPDLIRIHWPLFRLIRFHSLAHMLSSLSLMLVPTSIDGDCAQTTFRLISLLTMLLMNVTPLHNHPST